MDKNIDASENLPSVDDVPPSHFIFQYDLAKMKVVYLKESLKVRRLKIVGKKEYMKLRLQQELAAWVKNISEEEIKQPHNQIEGLCSADYWEYLKHMDDIV